MMTLEVIYIDNHVPYGTYLLGYYVTRPDQVIINI